MTQALDSLTKNLFYISETDAEIVPFVIGKAAGVTAAELLAQTGHHTNDAVEALDANAFFTRLTAIKDWFGPREKVRAERFMALKSELDRELTDLKVFKIGKIQIEIYVVGLDKEQRLAGVKTVAVET